MKKFVLLLILLFSNSYLFGQNTFTIQSARGRDVPIIVNGKKYIIDTIGIKIPTNYPAFDTVTFTERYLFNKIICNFNPDSSYSIIMACCGSSDIVYSSKLNLDSLKYWDLDKDFKKIQSHLQDHPTFTLKLTKNTKNTVYGYYADAACFQYFNRVTKKGWHLGTPLKCYYWNNISPIVFFKTDENIEDLPKENDNYEMLIGDGIKELTTIYVRFFDNDHYIISYNPKTEEINVTKDRGSL